MPVKIFFCYAHEDEPLLERLKIHLTPMQRLGLIETWHDRDISVGIEWDQEIRKHLNTAQIIILLVSPDFIASDYCYNIEMKQAVERHKRKEACVIPIILYPVHWKDILGDIQVLPTDARPVISAGWHSMNEAFYDIVEGIKKVVEKLLKVQENTFHHKSTISDDIVFSAKAPIEISTTQQKQEYPEIQVVNVASHSLGIGMWIGDQSTTGHSREVIRKHNLLLVLNQVREYGPISRVDIAQRVGLSRGTIGIIIDELKTRGVVHEGNKSNATPKGGRQATYIHFRADAGYIIGVDIGRTHLTILLTNLAGEIVHEQSELFDMRRGAKDCLKSVADKLQALLEESQTTWEQVLGIGLATPGPLDPQLRMVLSASEIPRWEGIDIPAYLGGKLKKKILIRLDNDANMGALGESRYGAGRGITNLVYVKIGTGIGAGFIINGQLYHGSRGAAGELGHIVVVDKNGAVCTCGNQGCLETVAAAPAIVKEAGRVDTVDITEVIRAAQNGDEASRAALERAGVWIGIALGTVRNLVNPSMILLDGSVIRNSDRLLDSIRSSVKASSLHATKAETYIEYGQLGDKAVARGAVANIIDYVFRRLYMGNKRPIVAN